MTMTDLQRMQQIQSLSAKPKVWLVARCHQTGAALGPIDGWSRHELAVQLVNHEERLAAQDAYREVPSSTPWLNPDGNLCSVCEATIGNTLVDTDDQRVMGRGFIPVYSDGHVLYCRGVLPRLAHHHC